jgi:hypothetical protein
MHLITNAKTTYKEKTNTEINSQIIYIIKMYINCNVYNVAYCDAKKEENIFSFDCCCLVVNQQVIKKIFLKVTIIKCL